MMYNIINELLALVKNYEEGAINPEDDLSHFLNWFDKQEKKENSIKVEPEWSGKVNGRTADSVINTSIVHLYRYAKIHAKRAIIDSQFATPDEFIYLINLVSGGSMSKTELIKENIHDKPAGTLIIKRLLDKGFIKQESSSIDKRNVIIRITPKGNEELKKSMDKIRTASANVTEPLSSTEKIELIALLQKLEDFHYTQNFEKI